MHISQVAPITTWSAKTHECQATKCSNSHGDAEKMKMITVQQLHTRGGHKAYRYVNSLFSLWLSVDINTGGEDCDWPPTAAALLAETTPVVVCATPPQAHQASRVDSCLYDDASEEGERREREREPREEWGRRSLIHTYSIKLTIACSLYSRKTAFTSSM